MNDFITTSQAAKILKVSDRTIRNRVKQFSVSFPQLSAYFRKEGNKILIDKRLVKANFEPLEGDLNNDEKTTKTEKKQTHNRHKTGFEEQPETGQKQENNSTINADELLPIFHQQLNKKDKQIESLQAHTDKLTEENRALIILIGKMEAERAKILIDTAKDTQPTPEPNKMPSTKENNQSGLYFAGFALTVLLILFVLYMLVNGI